MQTEVVVSSTQDFLLIEKPTSLHELIAASGEYRLHALLVGLASTGGMIAWLLDHRAEALAYGPFAAKAAIVLPLLLPGVS